MKTLLIQAPVATRSGYGAHSREIALSLIKSKKYDVKILPTRWGSTPMTALEEENEDNALIVSHILSPEGLNKKPDIFIQVTIPNEFNPIGEYNIGITAGIETDLARAEWIEGCNRMDLIIATSNHSADVLRNSVYDKRDQNTNQTVGTLKLEKPIKVLFEGVNQSIFHSLTKEEHSPRIIRTLNQVKEDFCFLVVGHWLQGTMGEDRKDIGMTIHTFLQTFKAKKNRPALVLKVSLGGFSILENMEIERRIQSIFKSSQIDNPPSVYLINDDLSDKEMNSLYNHPKIKAMISLTKGEGFGRPLLEFGTTGKPIVASKWSGHLDFLSEEYSWLVPGELKAVHHSAVNDWIIPESKWFTANYGYASLLLSDIFSSYEKYLEKSKPFKKEIKNKFTFEKMTEKLVEILESSDKKPEIISLPKLKIN